VALGLTAVRAVSGTCFAPLVVGPACFVPMVVLPTGLLFKPSPAAATSKVGFSVPRPPSETGREEI